MPPLDPLIDRLEVRAGTYILVYACRAGGPIKIGRLGCLDTTPGSYLYVGSAFGPGGIRARLSHHLRPHLHPHWHVDYLKPHLDLGEVWVRYAPARAESAWVRRLQKHKDASVPLDGFGASDSNERAHLFYFRKRPDPVGTLGSGTATHLRRFRIT